MKTKKGVLIAPSILSADFRRLEDQIKEVERAGADWLHLDVMDGHFVPNITFGPLIVQAIRKVTKLPLDTHLMIETPERYLEDFRDAGTDRITVHVETCPHLHRTIHAIKELRLKAGVTLNPSTSATALREVLAFADLVLVMTVNPGFGGQKFISSMVEKVRTVRRMINEVNPKILLEVDGGIGVDNAGTLVRAGADVLVAGNSIFANRDVGKALRKLRKAALS